MIKTLDMIGFAGFLRDSPMLLRRNHPFIDVILVRMERCLFPVHSRHIGPERLAALSTPIPHVKGNHLARGRIHRHPDPLLVGLLLYEAPHLIGFCFEAGEEHGCWLGWQLDMEVLGTGRQAVHHTVQEPREADTDGTADPTQREALPQQVFHPRAPLSRDEVVVGRTTKLAFARFALIILLPMASMTIFLVPV